MDPSDYISSVKEQLRAYDFEEWSSGWKHPIFAGERDGLVRTSKEVVVIREIKESNVETTKTAIDQATEVLKTLTSEKEPLETKQWYILLVPTGEVTKAMRIAVEREADKQTNSESAVLPIIANLSEEELIYENPHRIGGLGTMARQVDNYFKL